MLSLSLSFLRSIHSIPFILSLFSFVCICVCVQPTNQTKKKYQFYCPSLNMLAWHIRFPCEFLYCMWLWSAINVVHNNNSIKLNKSKILRQLSRQIWPVLNIFVLLFVTFFLSLSSHQKYDMFAMRIICGTLFSICLYVHLRQNPFKNIIHIENTGKKRPHYLFLFGIF